MVRSMMNLTTLSLSFWDYALETATRILNMVPTKKVDKTPYELWAEEVKEIQDKDTSPSENTSEITMEVEGFEPPQEEVIPVRSLQSVKSYLGKCFAMKDLGKAASILGIKIYIDRSKRLIGLSHSSYMDKILKRFSMDTSKRGYIPMQESFNLNKTQGASTPEEVKRMQNVPYASAVGSIIDKI
ncbi:retrotransposon protein, putative, ty1-copia subclass [Tanacetum coccineum]